MEELQTLIELIAKLPNTALWVLAGYLVYKLAIVGSLYGTIRFVAQQLFDWLRARKTEVKEVRPMLDGLCISGTVESLIAQLHRLKGVHVGGSQYIHGRDVEWLREAIDAKMETAVKNVKA